MTSDKTKFIVFSSDFIKDSVTYLFQFFLHKITNGSIKSKTRNVSGHNLLFRRNPGN